VVVERGRVAERWRTARWDSLRLITPNWMSRLPGWSYSGTDPDGYMAGPELVGYLQEYGGSFAPPLHENTTVELVEASASGLRVVTDQGTWLARNLVVATRTENRAHVPSVADDRLSHRTAVGRPRVFPGLTGYLCQAAGSGWALVGDAGYFKDPLTAHGITDALRDAHILARVVTSAGPDAVCRYQAERDELSLRLFRVTGRIASFEWAADDIGGHLRELSDAMAEEVAAMTGDHFGDQGRQLELATA
jgi:2-polyprenyl-6-methoxyphenol hydroxylase-like FAD-dependent oxidoreductase